MLSDLFESPWRIRALRDRPGGPLLEGFAEALSQMRYAPITVRRHLRAAEHFIDWTNRQGLSAPGLNVHAFTRFGRHLRRCRCVFAHADRIDVLNGARIFLTHLRDAQAILASALQEATPEPVLLSAFAQWMRQQRGTCEKTLSGYGRHIRDVLDQLGEEASRWYALRLRASVLRKGRTCGWAEVKRCTTALRGFVRFLIAQGHCAVDLDAAIPTVAHWRLAALPRYLQSDDVERVIDSCDQTSPVGRRNRAILLLLARLGLRAGDIVDLRVPDIDWKEASIRVSGKGLRETRLPLTQEVGQAIVTYLQDGRPPTTSETLFVRSRPPFRALASSTAVTVIVSQALKRAGVVRPRRGAAHVLRHSVATSMLRAGASLHEIGALLRHRSITTTQIYAKVDVTALQAIAQPWPEVQP